jgi:hypothetical protein
VLLSTESPLFKGGSKGFSPVPLQAVERQGTAFPLQLYVKQNSIVYINQATNNTVVALPYLVVTCGALFFSEIRMMVVFGAANLLILLIVMAVQRYAFTSVWCAYAAAASVIILYYFWTSHEERPFRYG